MAALAVLITLAVTGELDGSNDRRLAEVKELSQHNYNAWVDTEVALQAARAELATLRTGATMGAIEACNITSWQVSPAEVACLDRHNYSYPHGIWVNGFGRMSLLPSDDPDFIRDNATGLISPRWGLGSN